MAKCVFCDIIRGKAPAQIIYEDGVSFAFAPRFPISAGHTLIVPKAHAADLFDIAPDALVAVILATQRIARALLECGAEGVNLLHASRLAAQQSVFHFHIHLVPRYAGDGLDLWLAGKSMYSGPVDMLDRLRVLLSSAGMDDARGSNKSLHEASHETAKELAMISVREATRQDYDGLSQVLEEVDALHRAALPHIFRAPEIWPPRSRGFVADMIAGSEALILVAEDAGKIIGVAIAKVECAPDTPIHVPNRFVELRTMVVSEAYQRRRIGMAFVEGIRRWASAQGIKRIHLCVYEFNRDAIAFYEQLGFETLSRAMEISF